MTAIIPDIVSALFAGTHVFPREPAEAFNQLALLLPSVMRAFRCALRSGGERLQQLVLSPALPPVFAGAILAGRYQARVEGFSSRVMSALLFAMSTPRGDRYHPVARLAASCKETSHG